MSNANNSSGDGAFPPPQPFETGAEMEGNAPLATKVIVSISYANKSMGVACYEELTNSILCDGFAVSEEDVENRVRIVKENVAVTLFLLHPQIVGNQPLLDMILSGLDGEPQRYRFGTLKTSSWNERLALDLVGRCLVVRQPARSAHAGAGACASQSSVPLPAGASCGALEAVATAADLEHVQLRQALGALLLFMQSKVFNMDGGQIFVSSVGPLPAAQYLRVDQCTLQALQIFAEETHPNVVRGVGRSKEGFSIFGLMDRSLSRAGRQRLREWLACPFSERALIEQRQQGVALLARCLHTGFVRALGSPMRRMHDMARLLLRIKRVQATAGDWAALAQSLQSATRVLDCIAAFQRDSETAEEDAQYMQALCRGVDVEILRELAALMDATVDFEASSGGGGMQQQQQQQQLPSATPGGVVLASGTVLVVRQGLDERLDALRASLAGMEAHLVAAAHKVLEAAPLLQTVAVEYVPQIGYLVAVDKSEVHLLNAGAGSESEGDGREGAGTGAVRQPPQVEEDQIVANALVREGRGDGDSIAAQEGEAIFSFVYSQDSTWYFKHPVVYALDDSLGDVKSLMLDRQRAVLLQLEDRVLDAEPAVQQAAHALASLDALLSLATIAVERNLCRPELTDKDDVVIIKQGRHLLQELTVDAFVANDTFLDKQQNVALITGPNSSGKSVYLKQVGLIVYLAHVGSFVPAERAVIGITDRIFTRIRSTESASSNQSAFALDLQQMSSLLRQRTARSLCLVDEFGKGTAPADGISLLAAVVRELAGPEGQGGNGKALLALHFTEILHERILPAATVMRAVSCFRMTVMETNRSRHQQSGALDEDGEEAPVALEEREVTPLYRLQRGVATSSEGLPCAHAAGLPRECIQRAATLRKAMQAGESLEPDTALLAALQAHAQLLGDSKKDASGTNSPDVREDRLLKDRKLLQLFLQTGDWMDTADRLGVSQVLPKSIGGGAEELEGTAECATKDQTKADLGPKLGALLALL